MNPRDLVSKEEVETLIPTDKVEDWIQELFARYDGTEEEKQFSRLKRGITQELADELLPLSKYCKHYYNSSEIYLQYYSGSERSFDADIVDVSGNLIERIEVTMSIDGQRRRINGEALNQYGHAPMYRTAEYTGHARNREIIEPKAFTIASYQIIKEESVRFQETYDKKHEQIKKYPGVTLLLGVDLPLCFNFEYEDAVKGLQIHENSFISIKCVNISGDHHWCFK